MKKLIRLGGLLLLCLSASLSLRAQLTVQPAVSFSSGLFNYSYSISNQTPFDVSIVTLSGIFSAPDAVQNLHAPVGFLVSYDTGLSLLSFIEDAQSFAAGLSSGPFTFDSPYAPSAGSFEAIDVTGNFLVGVTSVPGADGIGAVPEPSTTAVLGAVALLGLIFLRKFLTRKNTQS
jgi:hypothetical protein